MYIYGMRHEKTTYEMDIKRVNLFTIVIPFILFVASLTTSFFVESHLLIFLIYLIPGMYMFFIVAFAIKRIYRLV